MNNSVEPKDWREEKTVYTENDIFIFRILGAVLLVGIGVLIGWAVFSQPSARESYAINLFTDVLAIIVTVLVIDALNRRRDQLIWAKIEKEQLIDDMSSSVNDIAKRAVERLRSHGWLVDGSLSNRSFRGADLRNSNLQKAGLKGADLSGATFADSNIEFAHLNNATLDGATLDGASFSYSDLTGTNLNRASAHRTSFIHAILRGAKLTMIDAQRANFFSADLEEADLRGADLRGARLHNANLKNAKLSSRSFDSSTILPDNGIWSQEVDLAIYTDPTHPRFWRSDDYESFAYD